jgi:hypothetical protein
MFPAYSICKDQRTATDAASTAHREIVDAQSPFDWGRQRAEKLIICQLSPIAALQRRMARKVNLV